MTSTMITMTTIVPTPMYIGRFPSSCLLAKRGCLELAV